MRNLKRVLSLALALVMVLGMMVITTSAADYTDAEEITNTEAVEVLSELGVVAGMGDGTFNPTGTFTREQAAKMITYMKLGPTTAEKLAGTNVFTDVAATKWSAKYIGYCANLGIIAGNGDGTFNPGGKLTDIALGKMLLVALGYDGADYVGANWATAVTVDMLGAGLVDNVTGTEISREDACEMILTAMKHSVTPTKYQIVEKADNTKVVGEFDAILEATLYCKVIDAAGTTYEVKPAPAKDTLLTKVYKVTFDAAGEDAYGRKAATYTDGKKVDLVYPYEAKTVVTSGFAAKNYTFATTVTIEVNGKSGSLTGLNTVADLEGRGYVGTPIELYDYDNDGKIEYINVIPSYLTKVTDVVSVYTGAEAGSNYIKLEVYNPWATGDVETVTYYDDTTTVPTTYDKLVAEYAKDDIVMTYWDESTLIEVKDEVTSVKATVTAKKLNAAFSGTIVADGKTYTMATAYAEKSGIGGDVTLGEEYTLYFDAYGNVIGAAGKAAAKDEFAVMTQIVVVNNASNGSIGAASDKYLEAELVFFDGTKEVVKVAFFQAEISKHEADTRYITALQDSYNDTVVKYAVNAKGEYELTYVSQGVTASGATLADSVTFDGTNLANNSTKFIIRTGDGSKQDPFKYAAYTGYANLPVKTLNAGAAVTGLKYAQGATDVAQYVYVTATVKTTSDDGKTVAFVTGAPTEIYVDAFTTYYEYPVIIAGEVTTLNVANNSTVSANKLWRIDTLDAKGYVSAATDLSSDKTSITTAAKDGIVAIGNVWKTYDESTVVYVIDANAGTVTTADITALNATAGITVGDVYVTYVKAANGSNTPAIAQIIAIKA